MFSPDGLRLVATGVNTKTHSSSLRIWDVRERKLVVEYNPGKPPDLRYIPEFVLASAGRSLFVALPFLPVPQIQRWDLNMPKPRGEPMVGHDTYSTILAVYESEKASLLASASDSTVRILDAITGERLFTLVHSREERVKDVQFTPDGQEVVTISSSQRVRRWLTDPHKLLERACTVVSRGFTEKEGQQYLRAPKRLRSTCDGIVPAP